MAIVTFDGYLASVKQRLVWMKTGTRTMIAAMHFSPFDVAGNPQGTLAIGNTANGVVPTKAVAGYPVINALAALGYLSRVEFGSSVACRFTLFDRLFAAGAYAYNANVTLTSQPGYSSRLPLIPVVLTPDYKGLAIWVEAVTAFTGSEVVTVTYMNQDGVSGRSTGAVGIGAAPTLGRCWQLPLQLGDTGVQKIEAVLGATGTAGTFNVMVLRRLWTGRVPVPNFCDVHDLLKTGMPQLFADSALYVLVAADSTALGVPELVFEIADG